MKVIGYTTANELLYELTADYAITEFGQVYEKEAERGVGVLGRNGYTILFLHT